MSTNKEKIEAAARVRERLIAVAAAESQLDNAYNQVHMALVNIEFLKLGSYCEASNKIKTVKLQLDLARAEVRGLLKRMP